ncbi:hypothetical protein NC653_015194 [Populus alba x Populus x berolinensis]|uniref:Uncharacterized protein n=1 Tax=Populus alba x Populus x berolinensis TaxID=444605 RepID=A0AAD6QJX9_9ROSI|nr:hypothetical protein NC653_015194 [Populus alba x Populus x berolinensis]
MASLDGLREFSVACFGSVGANQIGPKTFFYPRPPSAANETVKQAAVQNALQPSDGKRRRTKILTM